MATFRHELAQYETPLLLAETTKVPTNNDQVIVESLNRTFNWLEGSVAVADNEYIIDQTSETANGRWVASTTAGAVTFAGTALSDPMGNGELSVFDVPLSNGFKVLAKDSGAAIGITNGDTIPAGVIVTSITLKADNLASVVLTNQTGLNIPAVSISLKAVDFTGVASPYVEKQVHFGSFDYTGAVGEVISVTFPTPFATIPFISYQPTSSHLSWAISNITTSGFTTVYRDASFSGSIPAGTCYYKAEEK